MKLCSENFFLFNFTPKDAVVTIFVWCGASRLRFLAKEAKMLRFFKVQIEPKDLQKRQAPLWNYKGYRNARPLFRILTPIRQLWDNSHSPGPFIRYWKSCLNPRHRKPKLPILAREVSLYSNTAMKHQKELKLVALQWIISLSAGQGI